MPNTPNRKREGYLDNETLRALIRDFRRTERVSDQLGQALLAIARGVWDRYRFTSDRDDFAQEVVLHLMQRPLAKADLQLHLFNYLTTCAIRCGQKLRDRAIADRRRFETYGSELVESGRPLLDHVVGRPGDTREPVDLLTEAEDEVLTRDMVEWLDGFRAQVRAEVIALQDGQFAGGKLGGKTRSV